MQRIVLTYGLIAGAIVSAMMLLTLPFMEVIGFDRGVVIGYSTIVIAFLAIYLGIRAYRDKVAGGRIGFGRGLAVGLLITALASFCYLASWQLVYHRVAPDFLDKYAAYTVDKDRRAGATEAEIAVTRKEMEADAFALCALIPRAWIETRSDQEILEDEGVSLEMLRTRAEIFAKFGI